MTLTGSFSAFLIYFHHNANILLRYLFIRKVENGPFKMLYNLNKYVF